MVYVQCNKFKVFCVDLCSLLRNHFRNREDLLVAFTGVAALFFAVAAFGFFAAFIVAFGFFADAAAFGLFVIVVFFTGTVLAADFALGFRPRFFFSGASSSFVFASISFFGDGSDVARATATVFAAAMFESSFPQTRDLRLFVVTVEGGVFFKADVGIGSSIDARRLRGGAFVSSNLFIALLNGDLFSSNFFVSFSFIALPELFGVFATFAAEDFFAKTFDADLGSAASIGENSSCEPPTIGFNKECAVCAAATNELFVAFFTLCKKPAPMVEEAPASLLLFDVLFFDVVG
mmetsp:Transcript_1691/g.5172  ORF Transcript_1691/g.5172 Transcript_1691/m.5172 type:complete len:291 (+) Transcript_1691:22-894(+)